MNEINGYIIIYDAVNCVYIITEAGHYVTEAQEEEDAVNFCKL